MGYGELGLEMFLCSLARALAAHRYASIGAGAVGAATAPIISSLIWFIAVLATFYCYRGSIRQELVFTAEGNYEDSLPAAWLSLTQLRWKTSAAPASITCVSDHLSRRYWVPSQVLLRR